MIQVSIEYDDQSVQFFLNDVQRQQIPFATSKALNSTMFKAQHEVRVKEFQRVFTKRNRSLPKALTTIPRGHFATKRKWVVTMMAVRDRRTGRIAGEGFIPRQIDNRRKVAKGSAIAVPIVGKGLRRLKGGAISKSKRPRNLKNAVKIGKVLYERQKSRGLVPRYALPKQAARSKAGPFRYHEAAREIAIRDFVGIWQKTLRRAVLNSKRKSSKIRGPGAGRLPG